jgi:hypothetical protein
MKTPQDYYQDFMQRFSCFSDEQLIAAFNMEVGNMSGGNAHVSYLAALHHELHNRNLDYSAIGDIEKISFAEKVELLGNVVKPIS